MKKYVLALVVVILLIIIAGVIYLKLNKPAISEPVACTMEAKVCPDGKTYVGRQGPRCEFAPCPITKNDDKVSDWQIYNDKQFGYQIQYPAGTNVRTFTEDGNLTREFILPVGDNEANIYIFPAKSETCGRYGPGVASKRTEESIILSNVTSSGSGWIEDPQNYIKWQKDNPQYGGGATIADYSKTISFCGIDKFSITYRFEVKNANDKSIEVKEVDLLIKKVLGTFRFI